MALIAFAANSVLCRLALGEGTIDAAGFTVVRLVSGMLTLGLILQCQRKSPRSVSRGSWGSGAMLFLYAIAFSFAYLSLDTGTGALILFGSVQVTMVLLTVLSGHRLIWSEWLGLIMAFTGFVYLILPGVTTPSLLGFCLMAIAGIGWGVYTLRGRGSANPLMDTTYNFLRALPWVLVTLLLAHDRFSFSSQGLLLALMSGGLASGVGYAIWYTALRELSATQAAVVQLLVPVIAALGGVMFVSEPITLRLTIAGGVILGGILMVVLGRYYTARGRGAV
ncbi:DMT family transporter [Aestuariicella hydrocarbonica]|uniref:DMT family transporter n=1 Tax=Pseudomaricurvus hydrocarbonicus TaxID=1470433 RepID=A0A9E5MMG6_9GAMM|nr:DMT family transporter [Aestuariicella hydrocarbonica]